MDNTTLKRIGAVAGIIIGVIYLINPTAGFIELLPDNLPFIGNLDEAGATTLLLWGIQTLRQRKEDNQYLQNLLEVNQDAQAKHQDDRVLQSPASRRK